MQGGDQPGRGLLEDRESLHDDTRLGYLEWLVLRCILTTLSVVMHVIRNCVLTSLHHDIVNYERHQHATASCWWLW